MMKMEAMGNSGGRLVEGFGGSGQGESNGRHWDDHR